MIDNKHKAIHKLLELLTYKSTRSVRVGRAEFAKEYVQSAEVRPVFFLSTGRCGTALLTRLLGESKGHLVSHSPAIELIEAGKAAYEQYCLRGIDDLVVNDCLTALVKAARDESLYECYLHGKQYIETNNRITFLAPAIRRAYPNAKFVHIHRHPADFIRSGMRRNWYQSNDFHELGRIQPVSTDESIDWQLADQFEKIAWLWSTTNDYIENFLTTLPEESKVTLGFNNPTAESLLKITQFCDIDIDLEKIELILEQPINNQVSGDFSEYHNWTDSQKQQMYKFCNQAAKKLDYKIEPD